MDTMAINKVKSKKWKGMSLTPSPTQVLQHAEGRGQGVVNPEAINLDGGIKGATGFGEVGVVGTA